ncbi:hypothetical protein GCM10011519_08670 [Marmoricola endophyticus]|uniref:Uncharacterized protein n=1 Tax=Marmoricola endophyticus TaxID=2040280 RepID=A0A917BCX3_9ACTN|nr:hypothetical protein [Marmoricola endophyticus]GGF37408.1 hypothetical protein GCM10011519_08670 [Marmoricola endophyticus]
MTTRLPFAFTPAYRVLALPFGITPRTAWVELAPEELRVRFGPWRLRTARSNIVGTERSEGYAVLKTAGPPHLSFADHGISFATNGHAGLCLRFEAPVAGIEPTGRIRHPGATLTLQHPERLEEWLG